MTDIAGRTAFITGGANGIGLALARSLAREGARLALIDLDAEALAAAEAELSGLTQVVTAELDVRDRAGYARVADEVEAKVGPVSLLVNNAGVAGGAPASRLTYELWDWGMGINLGGVINGVQTFLPRMLSRNAGGHIVNTSSGAGLVAGANNALYCTAKFAVVGLSEALATELGEHRIGVTVVCPGPVATGIIDRTRAAQPKTAKAMSPEQRSNAFARHELMKSFLANGQRPEVVGEMITDAIRDNRLYVLTDRSGVEGVAARCAAQLAAMPSSA